MGKGNLELVARGDASEVSTSERIRRAIGEGHIWPAFQPLIHLDSGNVMGFEVLARWSDPEAGAIPPTQFIPEAEASGSIEEVRRHIVATACRLASGVPGSFILAINLSPLEFRNPDLFEDVCNSIRSTGFPLERIHVEITESVLLDDDGMTLALINQFKSVGMAVSLDDFGTGYSSLSRLHAFPFDTLKIDRSFVTCLEFDSASRKIATSLVGLGKSLGMTVLAEGVETEWQADMLRNLGCDLVQGWLVGKPERWEDVAELAARSQPHAGVPSRMTPFERMHQMDELYRTAPVGLCFLDTKLRHVSVNERFAKLIGRPVSEIIGRTIDDLWCAGVAEGLNALMADLLSGRPVPPLERDFGGRGTFLVINEVVKDAAGEPLGISATAIDITRQKSLEQSLEYANQMILRLSGSSERHDHMLTLHVQ